MFVMGLEANQCGVRGATDQLLLSLPRLWLRLWLWRLRLRLPCLQNLSRGPERWAEVHEKLGRMLFRRR